MLKYSDTICCRLVRFWLVPRSEGANVPLPAFALKLINAHVERCVPCCQEIKHLRFTTLTLYKASRQTRLKSADPTFAHRVLERVRQEEAAQRRMAQHRRLVIAGLSGFAVLVITFTFLSGFNALHAQWLREEAAAPHTADDRYASTSAPFPEHDPFQPPGLTVTAELDQPDIQAPGDITVHETVAASRNVKPAPIPDDLPNIVEVHVSVGRNVNTLNPTSLPSHPPLSSAASTLIAVPTEAPLLKTQFPAMIQPVGADQSPVTDTAPPTATLAQNSNSPKSDSDLTTPSELEKTAQGIIPPAESAPSTPAFDGSAPARTPSEPAASQTATGAASAK